MLTGEAQERAAFEAKFPRPAGVTWNGSEYAVREDWENSYRCDRFVGQWEAWKAARAHGVGTPAAASREHAELMLLAAADLESWMKSYHHDAATAATAKRLRDAALGVKENGDAPAA
jgi:hypothetical protein